MQGFLSLLTAENCLVPRQSLVVSPPSRAGSAGDLLAQKLSCGRRRRSSSCSCTQEDAVGTASASCSCCKICSGAWCVQIYGGGLGLGKEIGCSLNQSAIILTMLNDFC